MYICLDCLVETEYPTLEEVELVNGSTNIEDRKFVRVCPNCGSTNLEENESI